RAERGTRIHVENALQFRQSLSRDEITIAAVVGVALIEELMHEYALRHISRVSPPFEIELGILVDLVRNIGNVVPQQEPVNRVSRKTPVNLNGMNQPEIGILFHQLDRILSNAMNGRDGFKCLEHPIERGLIFQKGRNGKGLKDNLRVTSKRNGRIACKYNQVNMILTDR